MKKKGKNVDHQGKLERGIMHLKSHGSHSHIDPAHMSANKNHGMAAGFAPSEEYQEGEDDTHLGCNVADGD